MPPDSWAQPMPAPAVPAASMARNSRRVIPRSVSRQPPELPAKLRENRYGEILKNLVDVRGFEPLTLALQTRDRKSTRLNSSHPSISYAVFCLKKKKNNNTYINI